MAGDKNPVQIRTRKFIRNALLARRQFVSYTSCLNFCLKLIIILFNFIYIRLLTLFTLVELMLVKPNFKKRLLR